jgi:acetylornithine deacetylase/succinyl-diaminopimelate desuccinylase-like protein
MQELIKGRLEGLGDSMNDLKKTLEVFITGARRSPDFNALILKEMEKLDFDDFTTDRFGNIVGTVNGYKQEQDIAVIFPIEYEAAGEGAYPLGPGGYTPGIITALYSAAVLKRSLLPMNGDLLVCGVPRSSCCEFGVKYLFEYFFRKRIKRLKGIILCEPTGMNLYLGHKGRMEYEIVVKVRLSDGFLASRGINMLGTMFPLIHELETLSHNLPSDYNLGNSSLQIKDVHFCGTRPQEAQNEFKVIVNRTYVREELQENILDRARMIAESVYRGEESVAVQTAVAREKITTCAGADIVSEKEIKPWTIESNHSLVLKSLQALADSGFPANVGYWKNSITVGSYTYGELGIPTFGFGPGSEPLPGNAREPVTLETIKKAVYAQTMMIHRAIGVPTFGWTSDEI